MRQGKMNYESWQRYLYFSFKKEQQTAPSGRRYFIFQDDGGVAKRGFTRVLARAMLGCALYQNYECRSGARWPLIIETEIFWAK